MTAKDYCIEWPHYVGSNGYGQVRHNGRAHNVHRVLYEQYYGPIAKGLVIDHLCSVKSCINPLHLEAITQRENCIRGRRTRMNWDKVREMRQLRTEGMSVKDLVNRFDMSESQVRVIIRGEQWRETAKLMLFTKRRTA